MMKFRSAKVKYVDAIFNIWSNIVFISLIGTCTFYEYTIVN